MLLDGKQLSVEILNSVKRKLAGKKRKVGLAVILVGEHPASVAYVRQKKRAAEKVGFIFRELRLPVSVSETRLLREIEKLNRDKKIHGFIVQLPLPKKIDTQKIFTAIHPAKDVDGFHPLNFGRGFLQLPALLPATPAGILRLLDFYKIPLRGENCVVVGHSNIVGKPLAMLLLSRDATVSVCHEFTQNLAKFTKTADIVISATGVPKLIRASMLKKNCVVVDCGCSKISGELVGDVDFDSVKKIASAITPVPGGVGPMTVASLIENTLKASEKYRYFLERVWDENKPACLFVMLNPSTADEENDDPTIRRCKIIAEDNDFGSFRVVNLFAFRAPKRADLNLADDPIGPGNDEIILKEAKKMEKEKGEKIIVAWGDGNDDERFEKRSREVLDLFKKASIEVYCLEKTANDNPWHPLNRSCRSPFPLKSFSNF